MQTVEALQRRIAATEDLQSIVRTMKTLSAVTIRRCEHASRAVRAFDETVDLGLQVILRDREFAERAAWAAEQARAAGGAGLIVLGSDYGLCGRFNDGAAALALEELAERLPEGTRLATVGARAAQILEAAGRPSAVVYSPPGSVAGISETTGALVSLIERWRRESGVERIHIVHNVQTGETLARPVSMSLLPISPAFLRHQAKRPWPSRRLPTHFEALETVLARLVRQHIFVRIYRALAESQASEHAKRLDAMQSAERSIRDHLSALGAEYRQRRQEQITSELLDVVAGFTVQSGRGG